MEQMLSPPLELCSHLERLHRRVVQSIETSSLHLELIGDMKRLNSLVCAVAFSTVEEEDDDGPGFSSPSRKNRP